MAATTAPTATGESLKEYKQSRDGLRCYLHDLADSLFPFPGYRDYQQEILFEAVDALFLDGFKNVIIDGPTGIGKSPINITLGRVISYLAANKEEIENYFSYPLDGIDEGNSFYTTPQKQLRNQLANDEDLKEFVHMLKSRSDYICGASGDNCKECTAPSNHEDPNMTCSRMPGCTYWGEKIKAINSDIAALTFAMLVVDNHIPHESPEGQILSFDNRDAVIVDEGHNLENQVASLFAGFSVSEWVLPDEVFQGIESRIKWDFDRYEDVEDILDTLLRRADNFVNDWKESGQRESEVEQCENFIRKVSFCQQEVRNGRPWVVTVDSFDNGRKKFTLKPVDVDNFLKKFIWSRGNKRIISSATIPYRDNIDKWARRLGLDGATKLISKPMPFPEENRLIDKSTIVGSMSGDGEDRHWNDVVKQIETIASKHQGKKGLIHTTSYKRAKKLAEALGTEKVIVHNYEYKYGEWKKNERDTEVVIDDWQDSDKDILLSPTMTEGVDLYDDLCRWQILMKIPYGFIGDSRVSYLINERNDWEWYNQTAMLDVIQSVGRAVRGPDDYASYYVIDQAFNKLMSQVSTPEWFNSAVREKTPHEDDAALGDFA